MENKIIDYINQTPENTNPSVLATLLGELKVPKPLTYDYMPEGYPSKTMETTTLMEEQRLSFKYRENLYIATLPVSIDLVEGQTYVVTFDGIIYKCLCKLNRNVEYIGSDQNEYGGLVGDEPFCVSNGLVAARCDDYLDQYTEHTIGITTIVETVTPMAAEFLPAGGGVSPEEVAAIVKEQFPQIKEQFVVNFSTTDMKNWTCDKTLAEITEAINSGKEVAGSVAGSTNVDFVGQNPNGSILFGKVFPDGKRLMSYSINVYENNVEVTMASIEMTVMG